MMTLVVGRPGSGKSKLAEDIVLELSKGQRRIYIATMIPFGEDGQRRIERHRKLREGKGFETVECPVDLYSISGLEGSVCLLECVSNLVGNEMHEEEKTTWSAREVADFVFEEILDVKERASEIVVVTNEFEEEEGFDEETQRYIEITGLVNEKLKAAADRVVEV